jgi:glycosyltransferase involved in cell wall biosynthesis
MTDRLIRDLIPMRILHTESSWGWGGQELRILTESKALIDLGHDVVIATPPETPIFKEAKALGIEAIALPIRTKRIGGLLAIRKLICSRQFDVINTHSSTDSWLTALACQTVVNAPKIIRTRHVSTPVRPTCANRWLFGKASTQVVTTGEAVRKMLIQNLGLNPSCVVSISTGVNSNLYTPVTNEQKSVLRQKLGLPDDKFIVGTVATLRLLKGIEYLFGAIRLLNDEKIMLCVVGDGPQRQRLENWISDHSMGQQILLVGEQRGVHEWLQSFDLFAFPSLAEGVPQALVQAMLTELPCVTTDVGGIPELATDGESAVFIPPKNSDFLADAIHLIKNNSQFGNRLGRRARTICKEKNSLEKMAEKMELAFRAALRTK